jgi:serine protease Do
VKLVILRGSERKTLYVPAIEHRDHMDELFDAVNPENSLISRLGVLGIDLNTELRTKLDLRIPSGVLVVGRAADLILPDTGLQAGDIIHQLNTTPIDSMDTLRAALHNLKTSDPVVLQVERGDGLTYLSFEME